MKMKMLSNKKLFAFDMDGTLFSAKPFLWKSYNRATERFNNLYEQNTSTPSDVEIFNCVGLPVKQMVTHLYPTLEESEKKEISKLILEEQTLAIREKKGLIFDNVEQTITKLHKTHKLAIASNGRKAYISSILETYDFKKYFQPLIHIDNEQIHTKDEILKTYLKKLSLTKEDLVMVGDRKSDIEAARKVGCTFVGCNFTNFGHLDEIRGADVLINSLDEILDYL